MNMLNRTFLIIQSNIRQTYRQLIAVFFLVLIASVLLNTVLVLKLDYNQNYERDAARLNTHHFRIAYTDVYRRNCEDMLADFLTEDARIKDFEIDRGFMGEGDAASPNGSISSLIVLEKYSDAEKKRIDQFEILEEDISIAKGAYVSYLFKALGMKTGEPCSVSIGNNTFEFQIRGFYNNPVLGTVNCSGIAYILSDELYDELVYGQPESYLIKVQCRDREKITEVFNDTVNAFNSLSPTGYVCRTAFAEEIGASRYTNANLFRIVLTFTSVTMILITLAIIAIVMSNYVKANIRAFGTYKAIGYTSISLIVPMLFEVAVLCLAAGLIGIGTSYAVLPIINKALETQSGVPYRVHFLISPCIITLAICELTSHISTYLSVRRIRKIATIHAIKDPRENAEKKADILALEKTSLPVNAALGFDTAFKFASRSILVFLTSMGITFLLGISLFIYQNLIVDNTDLVKVICGEIPNYIVSVDADNEAALIDYLEDNEQVDLFCIYQMADQVPDIYPVISSIGVDKDGFVSKLDYLIVDGRFPDADDEIAVNKLYAERNGLHLQDEITFTHDGKKHSYKIVGFNQGASRNGTEGYFIREGLDRIGSNERIAYYIFLRSIEEEGAFKSDIMEKIPIQYMLNNRLNVSSIVDMYMLILFVLAIVLCIISALIAGFVTYIILSLLLSSKRREHGILKAIGYTTKDIVLQTELSILPFTGLGAAAGLALSRKNIGTLVSLALNSIGIFDFGNPLKVSYLILLWIILVLLIACFTAFLCRPISKISTRELFNIE